MVALLERPAAGEAPRHPPPAQDHCVAAKISHKAPPRPFPASAGDRIVPCRPDGRPRGMSFRGPRRMLTLIRIIRIRNLDKLHIDRRAQGSCHVLFPPTLAQMIPRG